MKIKFICGTVLILAFAAACNNPFFPKKGVQAGIEPSYTAIEFDLASITKVYGDAPFSNPLHELEYGDGAVSYLSDRESVATVEFYTGEITIHGVGTTTITAFKAPDEFLPGGAKAWYTITVEKAVLYVEAESFTFPTSLNEPPVYTWRIISGLKYNETHEEALQGEPVITCGYEYGNSGMWPITMEMGTLHAANYTIEIVGGAAVYAALTNQAALSINTFTQKTYGDGAFTLSTTGGSSSGDVVFEKIADTSGAISLNAETGQITILRAGSVTVQATKRGDNAYNPVDSAPMTFTINRRNMSQVLTFII